MSAIRREAARGNIIELTRIDGEDVAILDSKVEVKTGVVVFDFDKTNRKPAVRANEFATLLRDPLLATALSGCTNMEQRKNVLRPFCATGYKVDFFASDPTPTQAPEPEPEPVAPPQGSPTATIDTSDLVTQAQLQSALVRQNNELASEIERLEHELRTLAPTVIQVGSNEPVTFGAGELVHEAAPQIIEDMEDGLHVYMTGGPGTGKSRLAMTVYRALGFSEDDVVIFPVSNMDQKNSLLGWRLPTTGEYIKGPLHHAFEGRPVMLEELDSGNGASMTATNNVLDSPYVTFPDGTTMRRPDKLFILGAGNTTGKGGDMMFLRNQMDGATRNRWVFHFVDYDRNIERGVVAPILGDRTDAWLNHCWSIREALSGERVVFSTRNITAGAKMLRRGRDIATITERALLPGESRDIVAKSGALNFRA